MSTRELKGYVAQVARLIDAPAEQVWAALTTTESHAAMMFGSDVETDWMVGHPITWSGIWNGKPFTDKGEIVAVEPPRVLVVTHFSPLSGERDSPENYHTVEWRLEPRDDSTLVQLSQDNNPSPDSLEHVRRNWAISLDNLAAVIAGRTH